MANESTSRVSTDDMQWWEGLYRNRTTPWELNNYAPPFYTYLNSPYRLPPGKMVVLGCGTGHDALLFAVNGYEVTGVDFAPSAIQATSQKFQAAGVLGRNAYLLQRDIFKIHEYDHYFDYVLEHTCFCAIHPSKRRTYVYTVKDLLKPGGKLIGLFWLLEGKGTGGPPFPVSKGDIYSLFCNDFDIDLSYEPSDSTPDRQGKEVFMIMSVRK